MRIAFSGRAPDLVILLVLAALALGCAAGLYLTVATVGLPLPLDPNEGWNAYFAQAAIAGHGLYPGPASFMVNNYPPLSFYLVGAIGALVGDNVVAGRWISLLAFLAATLLIAAIARALGCGRRAGMLGALYWAAFLLVASDYVGMNDPEMMGHALDLAALLLVVRGVPSRGRILSAALLFVVAGFIKHNLVVLPLAAATWLGMKDGRRARDFVLAGALLSVLGLVAFRLVHGVNLFAVIASPRTYSPRAAAPVLVHWFPLASVPLFGTAFLAAIAPHDRAVRFVAVTVVTGVAVGVAFLGGAGVDVNALFDADIGLALGAALVFDRFVDRIPSGAAVAAFLIAAPFAIDVGYSFSPDWLVPDFWLRPSADDAALARGDIAFLRAHKGSALCETLSLCYWARKPPAVDVFNIGEQFATGARSDDALVRLVEQRRFSVIQFETLTPFPLTSRIRRALVGAYRIDHVDDDGVFLVPAARSAGPT